MQRKNALEKQMTPSHWITDIILLSLFILLFYLCWLGHYPLFTPDEGRYSEVAREMIATGDYITPRVNGVAFLDKPVLYYWLQAAAIHLFGIKEWALRLFPALFGVLGCITTYLAGRQLFDRRTGIISAIILATTPLYFVGTHYANLDLEVAVLISCSLLFFIMGAQSNNRSRHYCLLSAYIFAALAFLTKGLIGIAFPVMIIGSWITLRWRLDLLTKVHLIKGCILFLIIVTPWYILAQQANPDFLHFFFITQQVSRFLSTATFNNPTPFWFYLPIVLIGFFPWSIFLFPSIRMTIRNIKQVHPVSLYLLLWVGIVFVFFSIPHSKTITYILPIFPALALLVGNYLSTKWEKFTLTINQNIMISMTSILFAAVLFATEYWMELPIHFLPYLNAMAGIFILSAIAILFLRCKKGCLTLFKLLVASNVIFLLCFTLGAKHLNQHSTKPFIADLKPLLQPQDEVIHYHGFFQDVPLYLEKRVSIVADWDSPRIAQNDNWARELWYGMPFQDTKAWLINENTFWERWNSNHRIFVFLNKKYFGQFKMHAAHYYVLGQHNNIILLTNTRLLK